MANSTTNLDLLSVSQASKEVTANALFDAGSPAMLYGRRASTTAALTWGYYGGGLLISGSITVIANGTVALTASATNYVEADPASGAVTNNTTGFTTGKVPLYEIVTGTTSVTSYIDRRAVALAGTYDELGAASSAVAAHVAASDPHSQYLTQTEGDARYAAIASAGVSSVNGHTGAVTLAATDVGAVSSVSLSVPGLLYTVSGSPVTSSGTLAFALKTQAKNTVLAGPTSGADATPTMRALTQADLPAQPFDVTAFYPGVPSASVRVTRVPIARAVAFPSNFAGSVGIASVAATASTAFDVRKNGTSVGTITYAAGATTATFSTSGAVSFAAGDYLSIVAPATPDATLADPGFVLAGTR
jgi:hypothetical protein